MISKWVQIRRSSDIQTVTMVQIRRSSDIQTVTMVQIRRSSDIQTVTMVQIRQSSDIQVPLDQQPDECREKSDGLGIILKNQFIIRLMLGPHWVV